MTETTRSRFPFSIKRWPVRWRLAGVSAGLTLLILVIFALVVGQLATDRVKDDFHDEVVSVASQLRNQLEVEGSLTENPTNREVFNLVLTGNAAVRIVDSTGAIHPMTPPNTPDLGPPVEAVHQVGSFEVASLPLQTNAISPPLYLQYGRSRDSLQDTLNKLWLFLAFGVVGGTVLAALAGLAVAGRAMRPISSLTTAARGIATTRDPSRRIPMPESDDEVAELAKTLDLMLRELDAARDETQQMIQAQRDFVADASHELRTPLTSILANLELLEASFAQRGADTDEEEIVAGALGSSRRMR